MKQKLSQMKIKPLFTKDDFDFLPDDGVSEYEDVVSEYDNESEECVVCGEYAPYGKQCKECYYDTIEYQDTIDKNRKSYELREWYYNLKDKIYRMDDMDAIQTNCNKLIAIALLLKNIHNENATVNRVYQDVEDIITKKKKSLQNFNEKDEENQDYDEDKNKQPGQCRALDGHWLDNDLEKDIDDILYNLRKVHVYGKKVNEIDERTVKCDWFIPVLSNSKGIYIEFWGMSTEEYRKNKQEKIKLYKEYDIPLIQINKDEFKDKQLLQDRIETEINKLEKQLLKKR